MVKALATIALTLACSYHAMAAVTTSGSIRDFGGYYYVGYTADGSLRIDSGSLLSRSGSRLGCRSGCTGKAVVIGTGSVWVNDGSLSVGSSGIGILNIENGGRASNNTCYIGENYDSAGSVTITGIGSSWVNNGFLYVGAKGNGKLTIADGGHVTTNTMSVYDPQSAIRMNISGNDMLVLGNSTTAGTLINRGNINFYTNAYLPAGTYTPISEYAGRSIVWDGPGTYNAFGGTWDNTAKTFTVAAPVAADAGVSNTIATGERLLIADPATGKHAGASFGAVTGTPTFSAMLMSDSDLTPLYSKPGFAGTVLTAWNYSTNLSSGTEVMLSFDLGLGYQDPQVWHLSGTTWSLYTPELATYDSQGNFSFTVTSFSGYAVSAVNAVPEPAVWALLAAALAGIGVWRGRRRGARDEGREKRD
jgi:T5SS/PEP-CTERM-associated repeat protein